MSPIVRVVGAQEPAQLFISIEDTPLVLSDLRRSLPELKVKLRSRWPVESIHIEERRPHIKNPLDATQVIEAACVGLVVVFGSAVLKAAGSKIGDAIGDEVKPYVQRWVKARFKKLDKTRNRSRKIERLHHR